THIWLAGDHYKWRALRTLGVSERYITGNASDEEKFYKWAEAVPYTVRNPLYHWTHMELRDPFGITELLGPDNATRVCERATGTFQFSEMCQRGLPRHSGGETVGSTDEPTESLELHADIAITWFEPRIRPSFRPDKAFLLNCGNV